MQNSATLHNYFLHEPTLTFCNLYLEKNEDVAASSYILNYVGFKRVLNDIKVLDMLHVTNFYIKILNWKQLINMDFINIIVQNLILLTNGLVCIVIGYIGFNIQELKPRKLKILVLRLDFFSHFSQSSLHHTRRIKIARRRMKSVIGERLHQCVGWYSIVQCSETVYTKFACNEKTCLDSSDLHLLTLRKTGVFALGASDLCKYRVNANICYMFAQFIKSEKSKRAKK